MNLQGHFIGRFQSEMQRRNPRRMRDRFFLVFEKQDKSLQEVYDDTVEGALRRIQEYGESHCEINDHIPYMVRRIGDPHERDTDEPRNYKYRSGRGNS